MYIVYELTSGHHTQCPAAPTSPSAIAQNAAISSPTSFASSVIMSKHTPVIFLKCRDFFLYLNQLLLPLIKISSTTLSKSLRRMTQYIPATESSTLVIIGTIIQQRVLWCCGVCESGLWLMLPSTSTDYFFYCSVIFRRTNKA